MQRSFLRFFKIKIFGLLEEIGLKSWFVGGPLGPWEPVEYFKSKIVKRNLLQSEQAHCLWNENILVWVRT